MNKAFVYTHSCLAGAGFAVINSQVAWRLRPDLFASGQDCALAIYQRVEVQGAKLLTAKIAGIGQVKVIARSERDLARRIEDVVGLRVEELGPYVEPAMQVPARGSHTAELERAQRLAKLRALAAQEPPGHHCVLRQEVLAARAELARIDEASRPVESKSEADTMTEAKEVAPALDVQVEEAVVVEDHPAEGDMPKVETESEPLPGIERAKAVIQAALQSGPADAAGILAVAEADSISERTMQRAAEALGVLKSKAGFDAGWTWALPPRDDEVAEAREKEAETQAA